MWFVHCSVGDKVALVDASHEKFHDLYMETLEAQLKALGEGGGLLCVYLHTWVFCFEYERCTGLPVCR